MLLDISGHSLNVGITRVYRNVDPGIGAGFIGERDDGIDRDAVRLRRAGAQVKRVEIEARPVVEITGCEFRIVVRFHRRHPADDPMILVKLDKFRRKDLPRLIERHVIFMDDLDVAQIVARIVRIRAMQRQLNKVAVRRIVERNDRWAVDLDFRQIDPVNRCACLLEA